MPNTGGSPGPPGFPVLLVIRTSAGEVRWMEIRDYLKRKSDNEKRL